jgi:choline dehydrogenase
MSIGSIHIAPTSRGEITLKSASPWDKPRIDPKYLSTENDKRAMLAGLRLTMKMVQQEPLKQHVKRSYDFKRPAEFSRFRGKGEFDQWSDDDLLDLCRETSFTIYHPIGTAKMGPSTDQMAVVDHQLKVHGIEGLRVVDASIMPTIVSGKPQAAVVAIAEKAADMILSSSSSSITAGSDSSQLQEKQSH